MGYIYCIKNDINNKIYIGKTIYSIEHRFKEHLRDARNKKCTSKIHRAILKYGSNHFYPELLEECDNSLLSDKEKYYIQKYNTVYDGYNITFGGEGESTVDFNKIETLFLKGYNIRQISEITKHTTKTISLRLKNAGYIIPSTFNGKSPPNKDKGKHVIFEGKEYSSISTLARYLKDNVSIFKDKKINTIVQGISKALKENINYCGYSFDNPK